MNRVMEAYFSRYLEIVRAAGGAVTELLGDGLMALFEGPSLRKDSARAVLAALEIQETTRELNTRHGDRHPPIVVNIGLNAGAELVGITVLRSQSEERWFYRAIGPVTNIAARLCELAEQGKILVSGDMAAWGAGTRGLRAVGRRATVTADPGVADASLAGAVEAAGYRARVRERRALREGQRFPAGGEVYDLMVIGGGSAAFAAAIKGAELGATVAIVEEGTIGGTCVNIGCVPSKTLIKAAELCYRATYPTFEGLTACSPPSDWQRVVRQKDELVAALRQGKYVDVMKIYPTITLIRGRATLAGTRTVTVNGTAYTPGKVLVATGSRPWAPPVPDWRRRGISTRRRP